MGVCHKCSKEMTIRDDPVTCFRCGNVFDNVCAAVSKPTAKAVANEANLLFRCCDCLLLDKQNQNSDSANASSFPDSVIDNLRKHISSLIESEVKKALTQLEINLGSLFGSQLSILEGSVASKLDKLEKCVVSSSQEIGKSAVSRERKEKSSPKRKRQILSNVRDEAIQMEVDSSDDEVFIAGNIVNKKISYSNAVKQQKRTKLPSRTTKLPKDQHNPTVRILSNRTTRQVIVIKPVECTQEHDITRQDLKKKLDPRIHKINNFKNGKDGSIIAECSNNDVNSVRDNIESCLGEKYKAVVPSLANPKVKILGMSDRFESDEKLIDSLKRQNEDIVIKNVRVITVFENPRFKYNRYNAILEVDVDTFNNLMKIEKINIGWDRCSVVDGLHIMRCFKCGLFNHKSTECKNKEACSKCSGEHKTSECSSECFKCVNCLKMNTEMKMSLDVKHEAFNSQCPVYQKMIERKKGYMQYAK